LKGRAAAAAVRWRAQRRRTHGRGQQPPAPAL